MREAARKKVIMQAMKPAWNATKKFTIASGKTFMVSKAIRERRLHGTKSLYANPATDRVRPIQRQTAKTPFYL